MSTAASPRPRQVFALGRLLKSLTRTRTGAALARPQVEALEERIAFSTSPLPQLIKDINPDIAWSVPRDLTNVNGTLFFRATDGSSGYELWKSDGTESGTLRVKDINPTGSSNPQYLTNVNGVLFFSATEGSSGYELWKSNGTASGTALVKDIFPGSGRSDPWSLTNVNGTLFFSAKDGSSGYELWKSDGTESGTTRVKDINPGSGRSFSRALANINDTLFFSATDGSSGYELWKSDGTESGTTRVKDINPGSDSSRPVYGTNVNGTLFFIARDGSTGDELWKSDGTESGTALVKDILPGNTLYTHGSLMNFNGTLFFRATDGSSGYELWKSDGTESGTTRVKDINPSLSANVFLRGSHPHGLTNVNGTLFFSATDGSTGGELWKSDGSESGTALVKDINTGSGPDRNSYARYLVNVNGTLFFRADDGSVGPELWKSDGTESGTTLVRDINPGSSTSFCNFLTNVNGTLFFRADDGIHGGELWATDLVAPTVARISAPDVTAASPAASYDFFVTLSDNLAIDVATLGNSDVRVTGPNGFSQLARLISVSPNGGAERTATYRITPPGGSWDKGDNGLYTITLESGQVTDTSGNAVPAGVLGGFLVQREAVPPPVRIERQGFRLNRATGQQHQALTITNIGAGTLVGGFALVLSNLPPGVTLSRAVLMQGSTSTVLPISTSNGRTRVSIPASLVRLLKPGASLKIDLAFASLASVLTTYDLRFLAEIGG